MNVKKAKSNKQWKAEMRGAARPPRNPKLMALAQKWDNKIRCRAMTTGVVETAEYFGLDFTTVSAVLAQ